MKSEQEFPRRVTEEDIANTKNCVLFASVFCPCYDTIDSFTFKIIKGNCDGHCAFRYYAEKYNTEG